MFSRSVFILLVVALATADHVLFQDSLPPYCGRDPSKDNGALEEESRVLYDNDMELIQVQVVIRHGDRTSWSGLPCWKSDNATWDCTTTDASVPVSSFDNHFPKHGATLFRRVNIKGREVLPGTCLVGELTTKGHLQERGNGEYLRKKLIEDAGFLPRDFESKYVFFRTDNEYRTLQSAESLILGLYPIRNGQYELIDIHIMDSQLDDMVCNPTLCPKYGAYVNELKQSALWKKHFAKVTVPLAKKIAAAFGSKYTDETDMSQVLDCLNTHICHGFPVPDDVDEELYQQVMDDATWQNNQQWVFPSNVENAKLGIGFLLREIFQQMSDATQGKLIKKFFLYSGHDTTIMPILQAISTAGDPFWAQYASTVEFELYKKSSGYAVRVLYNREPIVLNGCKDAVCDFSTFLQHVVQPLSLDDPIEACRV
mmetsp:Transcript_2944/g.7196  ORF Transcript_2944/g.7196 Transcript_2944/m.7196 type:complete len:426 (-) Transcript_2944:25-1302(-)